MIFEILVCCLNESARKKNYFLFFKCARELPLPKFTLCFLPKFVSWEKCLKTYRLSEFSRKDKMLSEKFSGGLFLANPATFEQERP